MLGPPSKNLEDIGGLSWRKMAEGCLSMYASICICNILEECKGSTITHHNHSQPSTSPTEVPAFRLALLERLTASSWLWSSAMVFTKSSLSSSKARISCRWDSNSSMLYSIAAVKICQATLVAKFCFVGASCMCNMERMPVLFDDVPFFVDFFEGIGHLIVVALDLADYQGKQTCSTFSHWAQGHKGAIQRQSPCVLSQLSFSLSLFLSLSRSLILILHA